LLREIGIAYLVQQSAFENFSKMLEAVLKTH